MSAPAEASPGGLAQSQPQTAAALRSGSAERAAAGPSGASLADVEAGEVVGNSVDGVWKARIDAAAQSGAEILDLGEVIAGAATRGGLQLFLDRPGPRKQGRMEYLLEFLKDNKTVQVLDLSRNQIGDEEMPVLSQGLKVNQTVKILNLGYNRITSQGVQYLCEVLKTNQTVEVLHLNDNQIGKDGLQHLVEAGRVNTSLTIVSFRNNPGHSSDAARAFFTLLENKPARKAAREEYLSQQASRMVKSASKR